MLTGIDARAFEEMRRQHAEMSERIAEMSRRSKETLEMVCQMHAHSATIATHTMRMATKKDLSVANAHTALPSTYRTSAGTEPESGGKVCFSVSKCLHALSFFTDLSTSHFEERHPQQSRESALKRAHLRSTFAQILRLVWKTSCLYVISVS